MKHSTDADADGSGDACNDTDNGWSRAEVTTLVKHTQRMFETNFNASDILSLLPEKTMDDIRRKWIEISSPLVQPALEPVPPKRKSDDGKNDGIETADESDRNENDEASPEKSSPAKKQKTESSGTWSEDDVALLFEVMEEYSSTTPKWGEVALHFPGKTPVDCLTQWQIMSIPDQVKGKGSWTSGEDAILRAKFRLLGNKWSKIAIFLPGRSGKQCRERWTNHLDPNLKKCEWSDDEEAILIGMHKHHGNKWTLISRSLPGRSDNDVKNHFYSTITRKFSIHGKEKLTIAAIQQVFMLVTAGMVSRDLVKDWPGAPSIQLPQPSYPGYHYGYHIPPTAYHPLPPSVPVPYPHPPPSEGIEVECAGPLPNGEEHGNVYTADANGENGGA